MIDEKVLICQIKDFTKHLNVNSVNSDYLTGYISALSVIEKMLASQPKVGEWIPCSERMPKPEDFGYKPVDIIAAPCLVSVNDIQIGQYVTAAMYHFRRKEFIPCLLDDEVDDDVNVIAWMPLPEPYREDCEQNG